MVCGPDHCIIGITKGGIINKLWNRKLLNISSVIYLYDSKSTYEPVFNQTHRKISQN